MSTAGALPRTGQLHSTRNRPPTQERGGSAFTSASTTPLTTTHPSGVLGDHDDERKETAAAFWRRGQRVLPELGVTVSAVMTDNGSCYRSRAFNEALTGAVKHRYTRPYRPQTNGKVERFNRTLAAEWAYHALHQRNRTRSRIRDWIHHYNHHRPHTGIKGLTPPNAFTTSRGSTTRAQAAAITTAAKTATRLRVRVPHCVNITNPP